MDRSGQGDPRRAEVSRKAWLHESRLCGRRQHIRACAVAVLCLTAALAGCGATEQWVKPGASDAERDRDRAICFNESYDTIPSAHGAQRVLNQDRFQRCMSERGYTVMKTSE